MTELKDSRRRITTRLNPDDIERLDYWCDRRKMSRSEYVHDAVLMQIARESGDFDIPNVGIQRLNQLIGVVETLSSNVQALETLTTAGFQSLTQLTRGDNYLNDAEG